MLCNWIWVIHKLTLYFKALVLEATFLGLPAEKKTTQCNSISHTFPVLPSILVLPRSCGVKLSRHWSVCSCFKEADKCPLPTGTIFAGCRQAKGWDERAGHKTSTAGSRHIVLDDLGWKNTHSVWQVDGMNPKSITKRKGSSWLNPESWSRGQ